MAAKTRTASKAPGLKAIAGIAAAVITYLVTQTILELPAIAVVLLNGAGVGLAVYLARPQPTVNSLAVVPLALLLAFATHGVLWVLLVIAVIVFIVAGLLYIFRRRY